MRLTFAVAVLLVIPIFIMLPTASAEPVIVWSKTGSPYSISGRYTVPAGTTLVVEPGVVVRFERDSSMLANGKLLVQGSATEKVLFTSASSTPAPNDWQGIFVRGGGTIENAISEFAFFGFYLSSDVEVSDVTVRYNMHGIYSYLCSPTIAHIVAEGNALVGLYNEHSSGLISDVDVSGSIWGIYLYGFYSSPVIERAHVHDMASESYALTSIYNKPVVKDSIFSSRYDIFIPSIESNVSLINTSFNRVWMGYSNAIYVWNNLRIGAFDSIRGTPLSNADARIIDATGAKYATSGYGGSDPRTGPDGFTPWVLLFDWSFDFGTRSQNTANIIAKYRCQEEARSADVSYMREERFAFRGNAPPVAIIDSYQKVQFSISMTGRKGNSLDTTITEDDAKVYGSRIVRTTGPPDTAQGILKVHKGMNYMLELTYNGTVGSNPVHLSFGGAKKNIEFNSNKGMTQTVSIPFDQMLSEALSGDMTFTFDGSRSFDTDGKIVEYAWDFGDGVFASGGMVEHSYTAAGQYEVALTVKDDAGDISTAHAMIEVG